MPMMIFFTFWLAEVLIICSIAQTALSPPSIENRFAPGNRLCKNSSGVFVVTGLNDAVKKLVQISQLDQVLNIKSSNQEAVEFVLASEMEKNINEDQS
jgi:hypothetical protein